MKILAVDFLAVKPARSWRDIGLLATTAALAGAAAWLSFDVYRLHSTIRENELKRQEAARDAELRAKEDELRARQASNPPYLEDAKEILRMASFDWAGLFAAVETPRVKGVRLVSLQANAADGIVLIEIEGPDHASLLGYVDDLNAGASTPLWKVQRMGQGSGAGAATASVTAENLRRPN